MAVFLLDTNAVSDLMRDHRKVRARAAARSADRVVICTIVRGEVLHGIELLPPGRRRADLEAKAAAILATLPCEAVPAPVADHYARVKRECRSAGTALDENDLWIAATALALGAVLISRDRDFSRVPGLAVEDWTT